MHWRWACLVALGVVAGSGCGGPDYWQGEGTAPAVAVVGDSYVGQLDTDSELDPGTRWALTDDLAAQGWRAHVTGRSGWPTERVRDLAAAAVDEDAAGLVIVAGVNDVAWVEHQPDEVLARSQVEAHVQAIFDLAGPVTCVVWPTVAPGPQDAHRANRTVRAINEVLRSNAGDGIVIPEWGRRLRAHPEWLVGDHLHLSPTGEDELRAVIVAALLDCMDPSP